MSITMSEVEEVVERHFRAFAESAGIGYDHPSVFDGFEPHASGWSYANAYVMTRLAVLVYQPEKYVKRKLIDSGVDPNLFLWLHSDETDTQGFVCEYKGQYFVIFRGTESLRDARLDLARDPIDFDSIVESGTPSKGKAPMVHTGFKKQFDSVWDQFIGSSFKKGIEKHSKEVWLGGHSLGGAVATLAASWIAHRYQKEAIAGVYTIGQPRVGDNEFEQSTIRAFGGDEESRIKMFRISRALDPVAQIPLKGYKHFTGTRVYISRFGEVLLDPETERKWTERTYLYSKIMLKVILGGGKLSHLEGLVSDHYSKGYLDVLREEYLKKQ